MGLIDELRGKRVYFDTNIFIYLIEGNGKHEAVLGQIRQAFLSRVFDVWTSYLTLTEVLPPLVRRGDDELTNRVISFLCDSGLFQLREADSAVCIQAAVLRSEFGMKTPDALHVATALHTECHIFLTNDARIRTPRILERRLLSDFSS